MNRKLLLGMFAAFLIVTLAVSSTFACDEPSFCFGKWMDGPDTIPMGTNVQWLLHICIQAYTSMQNVIVTDRLGAELEIDAPFPLSITHGLVSYTTQGASQKVFLTWNVGNLNPGDVAELVIKISTDTNPAGRQEYTTPGCYEFNSGATLKFRYNGVQYSATTDPIYISVY